jgi:serine/threonine-protein kinase
MTTNPIIRLNTALEGRYRIERQLGEGGMATVYLADDIRHARRVAIKVLRPELAAVIGGERFLAEIRTTANLQHPHILPLFDSGEADGFLYYVMPFIDGETLREKLDREKQLGVDEAVRIASDMADALDYAHRNGVIHRDIKPANVLLHDGRPVVADFGIAVAVSAAGGGRMTETGLSLGTPHYMSPEQASADRDLTARSDVYSLGCVLYEMIAGQPPHTGPSAQSVLVRIMTEAPRSLTELRHTVPPHVASVVAKSVEKLPADRFESAREFKEALADTGFSYATRPRPAAGPAPVVAAAQAAASTPLWQRALPWAVAAIALVLLGLSSMEGGGPTEALSVARLDLVLGDLSLAPNEMVEISPDGSMLVASADVGGERALYLRRIGEADWVRIPGTEGGQFPTFSPDNEWIVYKDRAARTLVRVSPDGGGSLTLFSDDGIDPYFPHWGKDGRIAFTGPQTAMVIGLDGTAKPVPGMGVRLFLLPDGSGLLGGASDGVRLLDFATDSVRVLIPGGNHPVYVESGHILYVGPGGALYAQRFDLTEHELLGSPVRVLDRVASFFGNRGYAVSENGTLVHHEGLSGSSSGGPAPTRFLLVDSVGGVDTVPLPPAPREAPRFSRDGRFITFEDYSDGPDSQIHTFDLVTGYDQAITFEGDNEDPLFSPDGTRLLFDVQMPSDDEDIFVKWADNRSPKEQLFSLEGGQDALEWLPGDTVLFESQGEARDLMLAILGDSVEILPYLRTPFNEYDARVSPDGTLAVYESNESGTAETWLRTFPDPTGKWRASNGFGVDPRWAPDGSGVYFWTRLVDGDPQWTLMFAPIERSPSIRVAPAREIITPEGASENDWDVHPDGDRYLITVPARQASSDSPGGAEDEPRYLVVLDWFEELNARLEDRR